MGLDGQDAAGAGDGRWAKQTRLSGGRRRRAQEARTPSPRRASICRQIDDERRIGLIRLTFRVPPDTKPVTLDTLYSANLSASNFQL